MSALQGVLSMYGNTAGGGKAIIFVNTKAKADEVNLAVNEFAPCDALHGDISQAQREKALSLFREGKYAALVATDVAARGLDIPNVDLVVHYDVPQDNEAFLHRSGRTGRAGKTGTAVVLFTDRESRALGLILRATKVSNAELVGAPDPADVMRTASRSVLGKLDKVDNGVVDFFVPAAERLMSSEQPSRVLAAALAAMAGFRTVPQPRSLLTYEAGFVTLRLMTSKGMVVDGIRSLGVALKQLTAAAPAGPARTALADVDRLIGRVRPVEGQPGDAAEAGLAGLAFDLPTSVAESLVLHCASAADAKGWVLDKPRSIALEVDALMSGSRGGGGGGGRFGRDRDGGRSDRYGGGGRGGDRYGGGGGSRERFGGGGASRSYDRSDRGDRSFGRGGGGGGDRDRRSGGGDRDRRSGGGSGGSYSGSSYDDWSKGGSSGGGSWGSGGRSSRSGGGAGGGRDSYYQDSSRSRSGVAARSSPSTGGSSGTGSAAPSKARRMDDPATADGWGQW